MDIKKSVMGWYRGWFVYLERGEGREGNAREAIKEFSTRFAVCLVGLDVENGFLPLKSQHFPALRFA
jgi:hypothetical protein